jgi:hypothetical protein
MGPLRRRQTAVPPALGRSAEQPWTVTTALAARRLGGLILDGITEFEPGRRLVAYTDLSAAQDYADDAFCIEGAVSRGEAYDGESLPFVSGPGQVAVERAGSENGRSVAHTPTPPLSFLRSYLRPHVAPPGEFAATPRHRARGQKTIAGARSCGTIASPTTRWAARGVRASST